MPVRFGEIPGIQSGQWFPSRHAVKEAGLHNDHQRGISYVKNQGADAIVLSGGYEDDVDSGDLIIYTGQGGQDQSGGPQVRAQTLTKGNLELARSCLEGYPVRVIRKAKVKPLRYEPMTAYEYGGLYRVDSYWQQPGLSGHLVWRFRLVALDSDAAFRSASPNTQLRLAAEDPGGFEYNAKVEPDRREQLVQRIVRSSAHAEAVKRFYGHQCQICQDSLRTRAGPYVEAAHIQPLGIPHNGPDRLDNLLSLCPNHHVLLDFGGIVLSDDFLALDTWTEAPIGELHRHPQHVINLDHVRYHRSLFMYR